MLDSTLPRLLMFQRLNREWRPYLTAAERDFLCWFMDNTVCWGRDTLRATMSQMSEGTRWLKTADIPLRSIKRIISSLKEKGVIAVKNCGRVSEYILNLMWTPEGNAMLRVPKRLKDKGDRPRSTMWNRSEEPDIREADTETAAETGADVGGTGANLAPDEGQFGPPIKDKAENRKQYHSGAAHRRGLASGQSQEEQPTLPLIRHRQRPSAPRQASVASSREETPAKPSEAIQRVLARNAARRAAADRKQSNAAVWKAAWADTYPDTAIKVMTKRDMGMLNKLGKRLETGGTDFHDFLGWTVANWREVLADQFGWMTKSPPPRFPAVAFLVKFADKFVEAYASRQEKAAIDAASGEAAEYRRLRQTMGHDEALLEIGKRRAIGKTRNELAKDREEVARMYRVIEAERKKLEQMRRMAPVNPTGKKHTMKPKINHGDNPYDNDGGNPAMMDVSQLGEWDE